MAFVSVGETFLEVGDVAKLAGISPDTVRASVRSGKLVADAHTTRGALFTRQTVESFCAARNTRRPVGIRVEMKVIRGSDPVEG